MNAIAANILMWHYQAGIPYCEGTGYGASNAVKAAYAMLESEDMIEQSDGEWAVTKRGIALVKHWLNTPMPEANVEWVIPSKGDQ